MGAPPAVFKNYREGGALPYLATGLFWKWGSPPGSRWIYHKQSPRSRCIFKNYREGGALPYFVETADWHWRGLENRSMMSNFLRLVVGQ